jgi:ElaB/YqjD/DUF883 family membrane-anchored ribosome-binding protein
MRKRQQYDGSTAEPILQWITRRMRRNAFSFDGSNLMVEPSVKTVRNDMRTLMRDAQDLFQEATSVTGEKADELRANGMKLLEAALAKAQDVQSVALETGKEAAASTDEFVKEHPWKAVVISAGVGLLLGMLIGRK